MTQEQLGERAGLHFTYIGRIERGEKSISVQSAAMIAKALNVDISDLLRGLERAPTGAEHKRGEFFALIQNMNDKDLAFWLEFIQHCRDHGILARARK